MPFSRSAITWMRRTLTWSSSTHSWQERTADLVLLSGIAVAAVVTWLFPLAWWQILLVWAICLVPSIPFSLMGWLKVFGPVLYYDMIRQARRSRFIILRFFYALLLVLLFLSVSMTISGFRSTTSTRTASEIAEIYFELFMLAQFFTVALLTPAYVAGAISDEKERKTLEFMLATDLLNREIVLSKLGSRMANLGLVVLTGLPILSILQFLGGVDPNLIFAGFAVTAMTILGQSGLAIYFSAVCKKPREAIGLSYLTIVAYYAVTLMAWAVFDSGPRTSNWPTYLGVSAKVIVGLLNQGNLIAFIDGVQIAGETGALGTELPRLVGDYAAFHGVIALVSTALAIARLRQSALAQTVVGTRKSAVIKRSKPPVGSHPMLWKEIHCESVSRSSWIARFIVLILFLVTFAPVVMIIWQTSTGPYYYQVDRLGESANAWLRVANVTIGCLTIFSIGVRASTSITVEREKQTLDTLLTTPLDSSSILFGKWLGSILSSSFGLIWLALIWAVGIVTGGLSLLALPLVMAAWLVYAGFAATIGLWYSTSCRSSMRAAIFTIMSIIGLSVGHWLVWMCCIPLMAGPGGGRELEWVLKAQAGVLTPPFWMGFFPFTYQELQNLDSRMDHWWLEMAGFSLVGLVVWCVISAIFYSAANARFRFLTHRDAKVIADFKAHDLVDRSRS